MATSDNIIWASEASLENLFSPSAEKQKQGWVRETPPHEWFNWYMNRTDRRLLYLEEPCKSTIYTSYAGTRTTVVKAGANFELPGEYLVGSNSLLVYLDGILCEMGEGRQYVEVGLEGTMSNRIRFNDDIGTKHDIKVVIMLRGTDRTNVIEPDITLQQLVLTIVDVLSGSQLHTNLNNGRSVSAPNTRARPIVSGDEFTVPEYLVAGDCIDVYVDGLLKTPGIDYEERGSANSTSTTIVWKTSVPVTATIVCRSQTFATSTLDYYSSAMDDLIDAAVEKRFGGIDISNLSQLLKELREAMETLKDGGLDTADIVRFSKA